MKETIELFHPFILLPPQQSLPLFIPLPKRHRTTLFEGVLKHLTEDEGVFHVNFQSAQIESPIAIKDVLSQSMLERFRFLKGHSEFLHIEGDKDFLVEDMAFEIDWGFHALM